MEKTLTEIKTESTEIDWKKARAEGITNREQFLEKFPTMLSWIEAGEKNHGAFLGTASIGFADGRCVFVHKWEKSYFVDFYNPANEEESREKSLSLSYEAMNAFWALYQLFMTDEDVRRFWLAYGRSEAEVEQLLADEKSLEGK